MGTSSVVILLEWTWELTFLVRTYFLIQHLITDIFNPSNQLDCLQAASATYKVSDLPTFLIHQTNQYWKLDIDTALKIWLLALQKIDQIEASNTVVKSPTMIKCYFVLPPFSKDLRTLINFLSQKDFK